MNDLSECENVSFHIEESDYGKCIDLSSSGTFLGVEIRHFLARIDINDVHTLHESIAEYLNKERK